MAEEKPLSAAIEILLQGVQDATANLDKIAKSVQQIKEQVRIQVDAPGAAAANAQMQQLATNTERVAAAQERMNRAGQSERREGMRLYYTSEVAPKERETQRNESYLLDRAKAATMRLTEGQQERAAGMKGVGIQRAAEEKEERQREADLLDRAKAATRKYQEFMSRQQRAEDARVSMYRASPEGRYWEKVDRRVQQNTDAMRGAGMYDPKVHTVQKMYAQAIAEVKKESAAAITPLTILGKLQHDLGQGRIRPGVATATTAGLEKFLGEGSMLASGLGAMTGALVSSIALPIAWAIGNAVMNLPQAISGQVDWKRINERIGAMGGTQARGEEWTKRAGILNQYFGNIDEPGEKGKKARERILDLLGASQATGEYEPNQAAAADRAMKTALAVERLQVAGLENDPENVMRAMKVANRGNPAERLAAMQHLASLPYIRKQLIDEIVGENANPYARTAAENAVERRLAMPVGAPGAYDPQHMEYLLEHSAINDERVKSIEKWQKEQWRISPSQGWSNLLTGAQATELNPTERTYAEDMRDIHKAKEENRRLTIWESLTRGFGTRDPDEAIAEVQRRAKVSNSLGAGLSDERMRQLDSLAKGMTGSTGAILNTPDVAPKGFPMGQSSWTSFSGLAEQMQTMWSGAGIDYQQQSAQSLGRIETILDQRLPGSGSNRGQVDVEGGKVTIGGYAG